MMVRTTALACALLLWQRTGEPVASAGKTLLVHEFSSSPQGWLIAGDTSDAPAVFEATGGNPGGYISHVDEALGETWYFRAPPSVLAQLAAAEDCSLAFSLRQSGADAGFPDDDVVIAGAAGRLSYRFDRPPGTDWTDFSVRLSASAGWRWNWNRDATEEQMNRVLTAPTRLEIRGEFRTGDDTGGLDNFRLASGVTVLAKPGEEPAKAQVESHRDLVKRFDYDQRAAIAPSSCGTCWGSGQSTGRRWIACRHSSSNRRRADEVRNATSTRDAPLPAHQRDPGRGPRQIVP